LKLGQPRLGLIPRWRQVPVVVRDIAHHVAVQLFQVRLGLASHT